MDVVKQMDCQYVMEHDLVGAFLAGYLSEEDAEAFEKHFFECNRCWAEVKAGEEIRAARTKLVAAGPDSGRRSAATWRILAIAAALMAATLGSLLLVRNSRTPLENSRTLLEEVTIAAAQMPRRVEARLTLKTPYAPLRRGPQDQPKRSRLVDVLEDAENARASAENARALGLAKLLLGDFSGAVSTLESASETYKHDAKVWSDLSAAYLARADSPDAKPDDRDRALSAATEAVNHDGSLPEAWFNKGLADEGLGLTENAKEDWRRYLELDKSSDWAAEANERTDPAAKGSALPSWPSSRDRLLNRARSGDHAEIVRIVRAFPDRSQRLAAEELLVSWSKTGNGGDLDAAQRIADEFARLSGDPMLQEAIAVIRHADQERRAILAKAHADYGRGRDFQESGHFEGAIAPLAEATKGFARSGSPLELMAATEGAACRLNRTKIDATLRELRRIPVTRAGYPVLFARIRWLIGLSEILRGHPAESLDTYLDAERTYTRIGEVEIAAFLQFLTAEAYEQIGDTASAALYRSRALRGLALATSPKRRFVALCSLADAANSAGLPLVAEAAFAEAALTGRIAETPDIVAYALIAQARAAHSAGNEREALRLLESAKASCDAIPDSVLRTRQSAELHMAKGELVANLDQALKAFDEAETFFKPRGDLARLAEIRLGRGARYLQANQPRQAREQFAAGIDLVEKERDNLPQSSSVRLGFFQTREQLFDQTIQLASSEGDVQVAAALAEKARARTLLEMAARATSDGNGSPLVSPLASSEICRLLPADTAIVELCVLPDRVLSFLYRSGGISQSESRVSRSEIVALTEHLDLARAADLSIPSSRTDPAAELYRLVLEPALRQSEGIRRLIIVPDKELYRVPFAALRQPSGRLLVEDMECGIAPSASLFVRSRSRRLLPGPGPVEAPLIVADPVPSPGIAVALPRLQLARQEAANLKRLYPAAVVLTGEAATRDRVLRAAREATLIHFAGHALLGSGGTAPGLVLSPDPDKGQAVLYASEIMALTLPRTRLVVLGACDTARGERRGPEGVISTASAFIAAGVPTVLATLAPVDDRAAARLLTRFHEELVRAGDPYTALRRAQLVELDRLGPSKRQTDSWSAFQLIGG
jgi:CHAT domain-containing protein